MQDQPATAKPTTPVLPTRHGPARNATTDPRKFALLVLQLAGLLGVFYLYKVENKDFFNMAAVFFGGFLVHYWVPFEWKKPFYVALSVVSIFFLLEAWSATYVLASGLVFYGILRLPIAYAVRATTVCVLGAGMLIARSYYADWGADWLSEVYWRTFGALFMYRMMVYVYDLKHAKEPPSLIDYLGYFFVIPNYYFVLFPVIDFQTYKRTYYGAEFHESAQQGIRWIIRGTVQLLLYRVVYHECPPGEAEALTTLPMVLMWMLLTYMQYLRVSGWFHLIIGMMHLYGFHLPETHRKYLLASSITDFWRRINIYWKDFIVKMFYFPVFFRLKKHGEILATVVATMFSFLMTWALHSYQFYWIMGEVLLEGQDIAFWAILGGMVIVNLIYEMKFPKKRKLKPTTGDKVKHWACIGVTFVTITILWSLWYSKSISSWFDIITYWNNGVR